MTESPHYFSSRPAAPSARRTIPLVLPDMSLDLVTDTSVFSKDHVDPGTRLLLLEAPAPPTAGAVLDLGCGYGPIAVTLARRSPGAEVWAIDVNERALELTTANAAAAGVTNVRAATASDVPAGLMFAALYSNPPVRIGKAALQSLLSVWLRRLVDGGRAYLVVNKNLGADSLAEWLRRESWSVDRLCSRMGYRVLAVGAK